MNTDFRVSISFFRHPKTRTLKRQVGHEGILCLLDLWRFAAEFYPSGHFPGDLTAKDLEVEVGWSGKKNALIDALIGNGFLERSGGGTGGSHLRVHDWKQHNGYAAAAPERSEKARQAAHSRHARSTNNSDAGSKRRAYAPVPDPVPSPDPLPDPLLPPPTPPGGGAHDSAGAENGNSNRNSTPRPRRERADFEQVGETIAQRVARRGQPSAPTLIAKLAGQAAALKGEPREANHHPEGSREREFWDKGWDQAQPATQPDGEA